MTDRILHALPATAAGLAPYGTLVEPAEDGAPALPGQGGLELGLGTPRFYVMRLPARPLRVDRITRHRRVTQCLAALHGLEWMLVLAPPDGVDDDRARPDCGRLAAFRFGGGQAVILHRGTWHAGPLFLGERAEFVNLELSDTNEVDHQTVALDGGYVVAG